MHMVTINKLKYYGENRIMHHLLEYDVDTDTMSLKLVYLLAELPIDARWKRQPHTNTFKNHTALFQHVTKWHRPRPQLRTVKQQN